MMRLLLFAMALLLAIAAWSSALLAQAPKAPPPCVLYDGGLFPDPKTVVATCTQLIESGKLTGRLLARAHLVRAFARVVGGRGTIDHSQMIADATAVIENDPQERLAYMFRLGSYMQTGDYDRALQDANKYIELDPKDSFALNFRSNVYAAKGDYERALADDTKAVEMAPMTPAVYGFRASTYLKAGRTAEALSDLNQGLSLPNRHLYPVSSLYYQRAKIFDEMGRIAEAIADYREALRLQNGIQSLESSNAEIREALKRLGAGP